MQRKGGVPMQAAVSTACLFPAPTEDALSQLAMQGVDTAEIFLNAPSEYDAAFAHRLKQTADRYNMQVMSVHPYTAPIEGFMLFSEYTRRCEDFLEEAKRAFDVMNILGAKYYILHGANCGYCPDVSVYCERFAMLAELGASFGVTVTQENVHRFESQNLSFLQTFCRILGDCAKLTFDVKQAVRAGMDIDTAVRTLGSHIVHVHLSDHGKNGDCLRIGTGEFDIPDFLRTLSAVGFDGALTIELYRGAFQTAADLAEDFRTLQTEIMQIDK